MNGIETDRLLLRPFRQSDLDDYARILAKPEIVRFFPGGAGDGTGSRKEAGALIAGLARVIGLVMAQNAASIRVLEKIGMEGLKFRLQLRS